MTTLLAPHVHMTQIAMDLYWAKVAEFSFLKSTSMQRHAAQRFTARLADKVELLTVITLPLLILKVQGYSVQLNLLSQMLVLPQKIFSTLMLMQHQLLQEMWQKQMHFAKLSVPMQIMLQFLQPSQ
jgi:hypothetical protein